MRGFRSTFVLLVVLAGLLGYIYYFMKPGSQPPAEQKTKVFTIDADKIEELQVKASKGDTSTLKKSEGTWHVVAPVQVKADETEVSGVISNLASLEIQRVVDEAPSDLGQYGLAPPRMEVGFRKAGDKEVTRLLLGDKTATGNDLYVKLPAEKKVFLVSSFLETTFDRTTFDLRDKTILDFPREKTDRIEIVSAESPLVVKKTGDRWGLESPVATRADSTVVDGLIGRLRTSPMKSIAAAEPTADELKTFGLDKPSLTVTVGAGSASASLAIGNDGPEGNVYARDASRPMVFTVEKSLVDDLKRKAAEYRPKDVFDFRPFMATRLEVVRDGVTLVFTKATDKDGKDTWTQASPARALDAAKVDTLLSALSMLQVTSYVDAGTKAGADTPALTVAVTFDDGKKQERVVFGRVGTDVFATRAGEPGAAKVEAAKFDEALAALDALK